LPNDPIGFFELPSGYDRRDLKRAYGKAIRIYKPETHPAEFGLVRDAYERLEKALRYGQEQQKRGEIADAWRGAQVTALPTEPARPTPSLSEANAPTSDSASTARRLSVDDLPLRKLALIDPVAAMEKLQAISRRTPPDYFLAAILADATSGKPTAKYLGHLLDGLAAYPSDPGLTNLTWEFLHTEIPDAMLPKIVEFVAQKLRCPAFYMLTEPLWLRLIEQLPFDQWEQLLVRCERSIRQAEPTARTVFYLRILRSAIWVAPLPWSKQIIGEIEAESAGLNYTAEAELEVLTQMHELVRRESEMATTHPIRRRLLAAIRLSCQREDAAAMAEILRTLTEIARDSAGVRAAFPMSTAQQDGAWAWLISSVVEQMQMLLGETTEIDPARRVEQFQHVVSDLMPHCEPVVSAINRADWNYRNWPLVLWMIVGTSIGMIPVLVISTPWLDDRGNGGTFLLLFLILVLLVGMFISFFRWVYPRFLHERLLRKRRQWSNAAYEKRWRSRLFRLVSASNESIYTMLHQIDAIGRSRNNTDLGNTVAFFVRQDWGLSIFASLQSLLR
jgi:hypothetical protein